MVFLYFRKIQSLDFLHRLPTTDWDNFGKKPLNETSVGKLEEKLVNTFSR